MVTREEVVWAYRMLLGREPEGEAAIEAHCRHADIDALRRTFFGSEEFAGPAKVAVVASRLRGYWVAAPVLGYKYLMWIDLADDYVSVGCLLDNYEREGTEFMKSVLKPGDVVVDAGANLGWFTLVACSIIGDAGHVHAFEPRSETANYFEKTIVLNGLGDRVTLYRQGLSDADGEAVLAWAPHANNPGGSFMADRIATPGFEYQPISLRSLDDLALPRLDFLKADVEGAEMRLFQGARQTLERCRPVILSELYPAALERVSGVGADAYFAFLDSLGYRCFIVGPDRYGEEVRAFPQDWHLDLINLAVLPSGKSLQQYEVGSKKAEAGQQQPPWSKAVDSVVRAARGIWSRPQSRE